MDVVKSNFEEVSSSFLECIDSKSSENPPLFVSFDTELTGLFCGNESCSFEDTKQQQYEKISKSSRSFSILQFGACVFRRVSSPPGSTSESDDPKNQDSFKLEALPFNFNVVNEPQWNGHPNDDENLGLFHCEKDSINFLAKHGFDFNKWIKEGIHFVRLCDKEEVWQRITRKSRISENGSEQTPKRWKSNPISLSGLDRESTTFVHGMREKLIKWKDEVDSKELHLGSSHNRYFRKLIYDEIERTLDKDDFCVTNEGGDIVIYRFSLDEEREELKSKLERIIGFSSLFDSLLKSGLPLVGHNSFLDVVQSMHSFLAPVPQDFGDFKQLVKDRFLGGIFDTTVMAGALRSKFSGTNLKELYSVSSKWQPDLISFAPGFNRYEDSDMAHEAGFDAFMTGSVFAQILHQLTDTIDVNHSLVQLLINRLPSSRSENYLLNLDPQRTPDDDAIDHRPHCIVVGPFPAATTNTTLFSTFSKYGKSRVHWINDNHAFIDFIHTNEEKIQAALQEPNWRVCSYRDFCANRSSSNKKRKVSEIDSDESPTSAPSKRQKIRDTCVIQ